MDQCFFSIPTSLKPPDYFTSSTKPPYSSFVVNVTLLLLSHSFYNSFFFIPSFPNFMINTNPRKSALSAIWRLKITFYRLFNNLFMERSVRFIFPIISLCHQHINISVFLLCFCDLLFKYKTLIRIFFIYSHLKV